MRMENNHNIIRLEDVTKIYQNNSQSTIGVKNVTLSAKQGEFLLILGPSGSGKTTLLTLIAGFISATSGHVMIFDKNISEYTKKELQNRDVDFENLGTFIKSVKMSTHKENIESVKNSVRSAGTGAQIGLILFLTLFFSYFLNKFLGVLDIFELETFLFFSFVLILFTGIQFFIYNRQSDKLKKLIKEKETEINPVE